MNGMDKRALKDLLYEQVARVGKALASPKRLELLDLLAQGEKAVDALAGEAGIDVKLASAHLKALKDARLVQVRREGQRMIYRLRGDDIAQLGLSLRRVAEDHLDELRLALRDLMSEPERLTLLGRQALLAQARRGEIVVLDVRPAAEFDTAHLPHARSLPLPELAQRLAELPKTAEIVAYCRGPFCLMADEAVALLRAHGHRARKLAEGVTEWQAAGLPIQRP